MAVQNPAHYPVSAKLPLKDNTGLRSNGCFCSRRLLYENSYQRSAFSFQQRPWIGVDNPNVGWAPPTTISFKKTQAGCSKFSSFVVTPKGSWYVSLRRTGETPVPPR